MKNFSFYVSSIKKIVCIKEKMKMQFSPRLVVQSVYVYIIDDSKKVLIY